MRFDFFEEFWKKYEEELTYFNVSKQEVKSFYDAHCSRLKPNGEEVSPYLGKGVGYTDMSNNQKYNSFVEGYVYMMPEKSKIEQTLNSSCVSFSSNLKSVSIKDGNLVIEVYDPRKKEIVITVYDSDAAKYIIEEGQVIWNNIDCIEEHISDLKLLPDAMAKISCGVYSRTGTINTQIEIYKNDQLVFSDHVALPNPKISSFYSYIVSLVDYDNLLSQSKSK